MLLPNRRWTDTNAYLAACGAFLGFVWFLGCMSLINFGPWAGVCAQRVWHSKCAGGGATFIIVTVSEGVDKKRQQQ